MYPLTLFLFSIASIFQLLHSCGDLFIPSGILNHNIKTMFLVVIWMVDLKAQIIYN